jgi:hypothetical protein
MIEEKDIPGFCGTNIRSDRLAVAVSHETGFWSILPSDGRDRIDQCPCCNKPFLTSRGAKLVANAVYPLPS